MMSQFTDDMEKLFENFVVEESEEEEVLISCEKCIHNGVCHMQEVCNDIEKRLEEFCCHDFKDKTKYAEKKIAVANADRIRNMSGEELAWLLMAFRVDAYARSAGDEPGLPCTQRNIFEWLQQPAEGSMNNGNL